MVKLHSISTSILLEMRVAQTCKKKKVAPDVCFHVSRHAWWPDPNLFLDWNKCNDLHFTSIRMGFFIDLYCQPGAVQPHRIDEDEQ